mmetsp:Transcript_779/g.3084  ORF Transcript_779/g.3084 Transcript_779/m.3084 type:complete len:225 (+) Transcript_779:1607-2281(+)
MLCRNSSHAAFSMRKSISRYSTLSEVLAMPSQFDETPSSCGSRRSASAATQRMLRQSTANCSNSPSRWILTTTSSPVVLSVARCTCASDAAASGFFENVSKTASSGPPSSSSTIAMARSAGKPGTWFCSETSSEITSGGSTSTRVDSSWPSLMNVGPNLTSASLSSAAKVRRASIASGDRDDADPDGCRRRSAIVLSRNLAAHTQIAVVRRRNSRLRAGSNAVT